MYNGQLGACSGLISRIEYETRKPLHVQSILEEKPCLNTSLVHDVIIIAVHICGVIKQNQSEVDHIQFSVSYGIVTSICKAIFCRKPH